MAEIKWTQGQLDAINHNDGSMIVTAAFLFILIPKYGFC